MNSSVWRRQFPLHIMIWPALAVLIVYNYVPMVGVAIAFQKFYPSAGLFGSKWVGWDNFSFVVSLPETYRVIGNTLYIAIMKIVANLLVPITIAILLNEIVRDKLRRLFQTVIYLPHFLSWIILGGILIDILSPGSGIINRLMGAVGLPSIFFLGDNNWFPIVLVLSDVWKEFGFNTIVFLAAITSINPSLYEAAIMDGANRWKQTLYVTVPGMAPIIVLVLTLSLGNVLNAGFDQVFNLYSPVVYESGDIIDTLVYRLGLENAQFGVATAVGLFKSFVSLLLIGVSYFLAYRFANYRIF